MKKSNGRSTGMGRCPYLGLHDDSSTSLAYPSAWNYCYRAAPPASVLVAHQSETCLCPRYSDCTVYRSSRWGRLPTNLRGRLKARLGENRASRARRWIAILLFLLLLALLLVFLSRRFHFTIPENGDSWSSALSIHPAWTDPLYSDPVAAAGGMTPAIPVPSEGITGVPSPTASRGAATPRMFPTASLRSLPLWRARTHPHPPLRGHAVMGWILPLEETFSLWSIALPGAKI